MDHAYAIAAALGIAFAPNVRGGVDVEYSENPFFDEEVKGFFKLLYTFERGT